MSRFALYVMVALFIGGMALVWQLASAAGWQFCAGFIAGTLCFLLMFRWHYGWYPDFNWDGEDAGNANQPRIKLRRD